MSSPGAPTWRVHVEVDVGHSGMTQFVYESVHARPGLGPIRDGTIRDGSEDTERTDGGPNIEGQYAMGCACMYWVAVRMYIVSCTAWRACISHKQRRMRCVSGSSIRVYSCDYI